MKKSKEIELAEAQIKRGNALIKQGTERLMRIAKNKSCEGLSGGNTTPSRPKGLKVEKRLKIIENLRKE